MDAESLFSLTSRYQALLREIPANVCLIAVSKHQPANAIEALYRLGHRDFGENYAQELSEKSIELQNRGCTEIRWHFIGHLQSNKAKIVLPIASFIHTVDKIPKTWGPPFGIEVNIDDEPGKSGIHPNDVLQFAQTLHGICGNLLRGLMCIPAAGKDPRASFRRLRELELSCRPYTQGVLSMGMSADYKIAIEEGATHIRIGTTLFGERKKPG